MPDSSRYTPGSKFVFMKNFGFMTIIYKLFDTGIAEKLDCCQTRDNCFDAICESVVDEAMYLRLTEKRN